MSLFCNRTLREISTRTWSIYLVDGKPNKHVFVFTPSVGVEHFWLNLVNYVFSALPTYYMYSLVIPPTGIHQIDRFRKHCLWSKGDISRKGTCLAAWEPMCRSKDEGGLGIINIQN